MIIFRSAVPTFPCALSCSSSSACLLPHPRAPPPPHPPSVLSSSSSPSVDLFSFPAPSSSSSDIHLTLDNFYHDHNHPMFFDLAIDHPTITAGTAAEFFAADVPMPTTSDNNGFPVSIK